MKIWNDVLKFECIYQQNGEINDNNTWSGYVVTEYLPYPTEKDVTFSLDGITVDKADNQNNKEDKKRILYSYSGLNQPKGTIKFTIFPIDHRPIDYEFVFDEEDDCLYGVWYFTNRNTENFEYDGFAKLIIYQDIIINKNELESKINKEYYSNNYKRLVEMMESEKSNLQIHDETNIDRFKKAKEYFKKHKKTLILENKCNEKNMNE